MGLLMWRRSRLEMHVDILRALSRLGPLRPTHITGETNIGYPVVKQHLTFLVQHNLVGEEAQHCRSHKARASFVITEKGLTALNCFRKLDRALQLTKEYRKQRSFSG